ncbi:hypothetical protein R3W88_019535 [Solanum pinnatisectum]|uniref:Uncharacterized protein n=1 Tax=Solanum pinnatisectum TaxID=50273 RepID=A0AAV9KKE8_9SOLN|nr:hypothetical protein R3W88_019535 [Solanum pinnatisectum]
MVKLHKPAMLVLLETRLGEHKRLTKVPHFDSQIQSATNGLLGGIVIMWKKDILKLSDISITSQRIHVTVQVSTEPNQWFFSTIYASNDFTARTNLWNELTSFSKYIKGGWLIGVIPMRSFKLAIMAVKYTSTNKRYRNRSKLIPERLHRCVANNSWIIRYPYSSITHLPRTKSDHCPLQVSLDSPSSLNNNKPFRMEPISIKNIQKEAMDWNRITFGNIFRKIKRILAKMNGMQKSPAYSHSHYLWNLEAYLLNDYDTVLKVEEDFWKTKSKIDWFSRGDANTKFFHTSTINRRGRNRIRSLHDDMGNTITNEEQITSHILSYFTKIFTTNNTQSLIKDRSNGGD